MPSLPGRKWRAGGFCRVRNALREGAIGFSRAYSVTCPIHSGGATPAEYASVTSPLVTQDDGPPPGPMAGPNSRPDWGSAKNNGTDLVRFCELRP